VSVLVLVLAVGVRVNWGLGFIWSLGFIYRHAAPASCEDNPLRPLVQLLAQVHLI